MYNVVLEAALQSHPNYAVISEEVAAKRMTLLQVVNMIADMIADRAANGQNYGVILIPEGLIKSISEFYFLLDEISTYVQITTECIHKVNSYNSPMIELDYEKSVVARYTKTPRTLYTFIISQCKLHYSHSRKWASIE